MADDSMTVTIHGKDNIEWLRAQVSEGRFASESEGATECVAVWREDELETEKIVAQRSAEFHADPSIGLTSEEVGEYLEQQRRERAAHAA